MHQGGQSLQRGRCLAQEPVSPIVGRLPGEIIIQHARYANALHNLVDNVKPIARRNSVHCLPGDN